MKSPPLTLHPEIRAKLDAGEHVDLLCHHRGRMLQTIDFQNEVVRESFNSGKYQIFLTGSIPSAKEGGQELVCLLPNHKKEKKQVIRAWDYFRLSSFNKDINEAFEVSLESTDVCQRIKFAVCYGNHVFICKEITGTIYICWASHVNRVNVGNVANTQHRNVPLILNLDGQARFKALYILTPNVSDASDLDRIPITRENPNILYTTRSSIFVCETRADLRGQQPFHTSITTVSRRDALAVVTTQTKDSVSVLKRATNQFESSVDNEEIGYLSEGGSGGSIQFSRSFDAGEPDGGTPRPALYLQEVNLDLLKRGGVTPPIVRSDGEKPGDPFEEEEEEEETKKSKEEIIL